MTITQHTNTDYTHLQQRHGNMVGGDIREFAFVRFPNGLNLESCVM